MGHYVKKDNHLLLLNGEGSQVPDLYLVLMRTWTHPSWQSHVPLFAREIGNVLAPTPLQRKMCCKKRGILYLAKQAVYFLPSQVFESSEVRYWKGKANVVRYAQLEERIWYRHNSCTSLRTLVSYSYFFFKGNMSTSGMHDIKTHKKKENCHSKL